MPYRFGFGVDQENPLRPDLKETFMFADLCAQLGVKILNLTAGSPYYNPHIQRPAAYPPSDGYQPPEDPLCGVARQVGMVRQVRARCVRQMIILGSAYSYLQEYLPHVAQALVRDGWTDMVGIGRMTLSYPSIFADAMQTGRIESKKICRTFSDCTTAPRKGLISGCYPLDEYYSTKPEAQTLKKLKSAAAIAGS
jgi:2,4-dienoyl-CoA reductase-like NADH-dependent reductase (Old Yellow Enzyme family)